MNLIPPTQWDSYFDLFGSGRVYFGRATFGKGQRVGTPPIIAMFQGLEPYYPTEPFIVTSRDSMLKINKEMEEARAEEKSRLNELKALLYEQQRKMQGI
jgi:hypothetical protein